MIPRLIHQTWKDHNVPGPRSWQESWRRHNPGWDYRLWTDGDLLALVRDHYPALEALYLSYPNPVQRADLGRYLILHRHGGIYADIDTECLAPVEVLAAEDRVVLAEEPVEHRHHALALGLARMLFNGVMASPAGHPFWLHVIETAQRSRHAARRVLESTGPLMLTGAVENYPAPQHLALQSCHVFNPLTKDGRETVAPVHGAYAGLRLANHYWKNSWFTPPASMKGLRAVKRALRKARYRLTRGAFLSREDVAADLDFSLLHQPLRDDAGRDDAGNIVVLIPVRDAAPFLDRCFELLCALAWPKERLKLVFCEGDSVDDTARKLRSLADRHRPLFRDIVLTRCDTGAALERSQRWKPKLQRRRRANLARVRNHLIEHGLSGEDDWALWIDADVCDYAPDILTRLLAERRKVVTPDCTLEPDGTSYDLNAFLEPVGDRDAGYYKHVRGGLFMPPADYGRRLHLHEMRFLDRVPLSSVGGTMLLVHGTVHRAGLRFPELPYDDLLETEGFGRLCRDFGVTPTGLPNVRIMHHPS